MFVELVVFDMAGTTVRDQDNVASALKSALENAGIEVSIPEINAVMGWPKPRAIEHLVSSRAESRAVDVAAIHRDFVRQMIDHYLYDRSVREVAGTSAVFRWLHDRGVKVALDTGFSRPIADAIVERLRFRSLVDAVVTSDEVTRGRPHPDLIFRAMERAGVREVENVAKIGDTPSDLAEGKAAGCGLVIGVTRGSHSAEELARHPHDLLLPTVASLPGALLTKVRWPRKLVA